MIALENGTNRPLKAAGGCWTTKLRAKRPKEVQTAAQFSRTLLERTRERIKPMIGIDPSIDRSTNQPINQSTNQPINQQNNQPINQSTHQPINQSHLLRHEFACNIQTQENARNTKANNSACLA